MQEGNADANIFSSNTVCISFFLQIYGSSKVIDYCKFGDEG